jgi:hypothetical protein
VTDPTDQPAAPPEPAPGQPSTPPVRSGAPAGPTYKGAPLDAERGPGLGCFWIQVVVLGVLLVLTPLTVVWGWPEWVSMVLLIVTLVLTLFAGQTVIFLLRLVAADRRSRRRPMSTTARRTVGQLEEDLDPRGAAAEADVTESTTADRDS